jgi:hypothetical protein
MHTPFSFNREFDFVRIDGLRRATGRPPHEWDIYILKELLDNALDADDAPWQRNHTHYPTMHVSVEYIPIPKMKAQQLLIKVSNRAMFPVELIEDIFHTMWYTSRKAFIKGLTRGALGNALKTLLGIPYALRNKVAGDWQPTLKPLSIRCGTMEYLPQYHVNELKQQVSVAWETHEKRAVNGTLISIGVDNFQQEQPRTLEELQTLAQQYHLCNPHAAFTWSVKLDGNLWTQEYQPDQHWVQKFQGVAPIHWYSLTAFRDVLGALYRQQNDDQEDGQVLLESIYRSFIPPESADEIARACAFGKSSLTSADVEGTAGNELYLSLLEQSPHFDPLQLGSVGHKHIRAIITSALDLDGELCYRCITSNDPDVPFVLEAAVAYCKTGKRQIWTAMNFSPTYDDPFRSRKLIAPVLPSESVFGLRGLLDAYGLLEETSVLVFLHLICPNMKHHEYSKTEIDHLPFKEDLGKLFDDILTELRQRQEEEALQLEETIRQMIATILGEVKTGERFILGQLLAQVQRRLQDNPHHTIWLKRVDAPGRLQSAIIQYLTANITLSQSIAHPPMSTLTVPLHPDRHFQLSTEHLSQEVLDKHSVNKILYIQERELEAVAIENNWLCQMDMALLHNPQDPARLQDVLLHCLSRCRVPMMIWYNADNMARNLIEQMRGWLAERHMDTKRLVDLGQRSTTGQINPLVMMMPGEQATWLRQHLHSLSIPIKAIPNNQKIRHDLSKRMEQLMLGQLMEHVKVDLAELFRDLDQQLCMTETMIKKQADVEVSEHLFVDRCLDAYEMVIEQVAQEHFAAIVQSKSAILQQLMSHVRLIRRQERE